MTRSIFYVDDVNIARACVAFAEELGLSVTSDISDIQEDNYLTIGSKNYDINWIRNEDYANKKASAADIFISALSDNVDSFVNTCVEIYNENNNTDEVSLEDDEDEFSPDRNTIVALFSKVKSQKKSPARYYVVYKNDNWVASTNSDGSYGNLALLMEA